MTAAAGRSLRTPSLRRRVTLAVLAVLAVMLLAVGVTTDLVLENRLDGQLRQRLVDRAGIASALVDRVDARDLARRLEGDGVSAVLTTASGAVYAEGPLAGAATAGGTGTTDATPAAEPPATGPGKPGKAGKGPAVPTPAGPAAKTPVTQQGDVLSVTRTLSDGSSVVLLADARDVRSTLDQVRVALVLAALLVLLLGAAVVPLVVGRAVRPLRTITEVARSITDGDRGRRLDPTDARTDLGATASAFDAMLDEVVGAEQRAVASEARVRAFLGDAAHDLRTPLTGVLAATEHVLREDPPRAEREQTLLTAIRETRRAARLVEDMLLSATIDQGLRLDLAPVDLGALADQVAGAERVASPDVVVDVRVPDRPSVVVTGDSDRLHRVLSNLVHNAVQAGATAVTLDLHGRRDGRVVVDVRDDGPGVPPDQRQRIFERLVRLDAARSTGPGTSTGTGAGSGSGLGLSIARGLARAHGGDLVCLEPSGPGALFRLSLPAAEGPGPSDPVATVTR
ncbi:HAMP domain-containing sensor histidine kinase [Nocardioides korecus]